jgi:hypothetical protein
MLFEKDDEEGSFSSVFYQKGLTNSFHKSSTWLS